MFANNVVVPFRNGLHSNRRVRPLSATVQDTWRWLKRTVDIMASRRHLAEMDDRTLQDLGISRAQAQFEASRPLWDVAPGQPRR
jgi:uncharacterized protein YjiS (DUF1127 family)